MQGCLPFSQYYPLLTLKTPQRPHTPQTPLHPIQGVPSLVSTHLYLCSVTISHRPDEKASVWRL